MTSAAVSVVCRVHCGVGLQFVFLSMVPALSAASVTLYSGAIWRSVRHNNELMVCALVGAVYSLVLGTGKLLSLAETVDSRIRFRVVN
jgi:hypothetical protein